MKNVLAIIIIMISSTLSGLHLSKSLVLRVYELEKTLVYIAYCKMQISYMAQNIQTITKAFIDVHKNNLPVFISGKTIISSENSAQNEILNSLDSKAAKSSLNSEDIKCIKAFISALGKGDIENQIALCELYENLISERLKQAKQIAEKQAGLYTMLSVLVGLAISVLLI